MNQLSIAGVSPSIMHRQSMELLRGKNEIFLFAEPSLSLSLCSSSMAIFAAAAKPLSPSTLLTCKLSCPAPTNILRQHPPYLSSLQFQLQAPKSKRAAVVVSLSSLHELATTSTSMYEIAENVGYSLASYYTSLGLFVISVPGLWSLIKRSVKSKDGVYYVINDRLTMHCHPNWSKYIFRGQVVITFQEQGVGVQYFQVSESKDGTAFENSVVQKTFVEEENKGPNQVAGEILSFFTRNNFVVSDRGETITGAYYWQRASRKEQIKVKMMVGDDGTLSEIIVQGDDVQVEEMRKELKLSEKGMDQFIDALDGLAANHVKTCLTQDNGRLVHQQPE
ncbi:hypothetical protein ACLOJK_019590 [Asimina triloba]